MPHPQRLTPKSTGAINELAVRPTIQNDVFARYHVRFGSLGLVLINHADICVGLERQSSRQTSFILSHQQETMSNLTTQRSSPSMARLRQGQKPLLWRP